MNFFSPIRHKCADSHENFSRWFFYATDIHRDILSYGVTRAQWVGADTRRTNYYVQRNVILSSTFFHCTIDTRVSFLSLLCLSLFRRGTQHPPQSGPYLTLLITLGFPLFLVKPHPLIFFLHRPLHMNTSNHVLSLQLLYKWPRSGGQKRASGVVSKPNKLV